MTPLWIVPAVVAVTGLVVLGMYARALGTAAEDLRAQFQTIGELKTAMDRLRHEVAEARAARMGRH